MPKFLTDVAINESSRRLAILKFWQIYLRSKFELNLAIFETSLTRLTCEGLVSGALSGVKSEED